MTKINLLKHTATLSIILLSNNVLANDLEINNSYKIIKEDNATIRKYSTGANKCRVIDLDWIDNKTGIRKTQIESPTLQLSKDDSLAIKIPLNLMLNINNIEFLSPYLQASASISKLPCNYEEAQSPSGLSCIQDFGFNNRNHQTILMRVSTEDIKENVSKSRYCNIAPNLINNAHYIYANIKFGAYDSKSRLKTRTKENWRNSTFDNSFCPIDKGCRVNLVINNKINNLQDK